MSQPSGWYDDPRNPEQLRYWDGVLWTDHTTPKRPPAASTSTQWGPSDGPASGGSPGGMPPTEASWGSATGRQPTQPAPPRDQPGSYGYRGYPQQPPARQGYDQPPAGYGYGAAPQVAWEAGRRAAPDGTPLADWWQRLLARIVDGLIVLVLVTIVGLPWISGLVATMSDYMAEMVRQVEAGVATAPDQTALQEQLTQYIVPLTLVMVAVGIVYETYFLVRSGATPGKKVIGITVRRVGRPGSLTVTEALRRQVIQQGCNLASLVPVGSLIAFFLQPLDVLWLLWDPKRQALHDKMADTLVVRVPRVR